MISRPNNWDNVQAFRDRQKLPVGAYVCYIKQSVVQENSCGNQLCVLFDISAGEYAGYYDDGFKRDQRKDKKWKGVLRLWLPKEDGSDKDEWTKSILKGFIAAVEESNRGYKWDWNEKSLAKKEIGILFRNEEWEYEGKTGWATRPFRAISVDSVEDGSYTIPKDKPLKNEPTPVQVPTYDNYSVPGAQDFTMLENDDEQLPF
mgnify:FL=1